MNPSLVYLHIPKSAGTSQRAYMRRVLGEGNVFWYGLDIDTESFDAQDVGDALVIGGHRELSFYPKGFDALYTAVVRNPVDRAVSYFNYLTRVSSKLSDEWRAEREREVADWREKGVDPDSMARSVENCEEFRNRISNYQCAYLSRHGATFADVQRTMQSEHMAVGIFEDLSKFNRYFQWDLHFNQENIVKSNVGDPGYSQQILAEPGLSELVQSLNAEDQALYDHIRDSHEGLWVSAGNAQQVGEAVSGFVNESNLQAAPGEFDWSKVRFFSRGIASINIDERVKIPVVIENVGAKDVIFTETADRSFGVGWTVTDDKGERIQEASGVARVKLNLLAKQSRSVYVDICLKSERLNGRRPKSIEFSLVDTGTWLREQFPLNSAWVICL